MAESRGMFLVAGLVLAFDQVTKAIVVSSLDRYATIPVIEGWLNLVHVRNPGAAFSLFAGASSSFRTPFFVILTLAAVVGLFLVSRRLGAEERMQRLALGGVLGGAIGNFVDRLRYGEVVDFIDVYWRSYHWPAFNVADSAITIAVAVIILHSLWPRPTAGRSA